MRGKKRSAPPDDRRCTHLKADGQRCNQWTVLGLSTCHSHTPHLRENKRKPHMAANRNAQKTGFYAQPLKPIKTLEDELDDLTLRHYQLFLFVDQNKDELEIRDLSRISTNLIKTVRRYIRKRAK
jgi:hypothetical protein